ncbi:hypothetical protein [Acidithiobacillus sp.]
MSSNWDETLNISLIRQYILSTFPDAIYCGITGSRVVSQHNASSDVDLVVLVDQPSRPVHFGAYLDGMRIDGMAASLPEWRMKLEADRAQRLCGLARETAQAEAVYDKHHLHETLVDTSKEILLRGPVPYTEDEWLRLRAALSELIDDWIYATPDERAFIWAIGFFYCYEATCAKSEAWLGVGKWGFRNLAEKAPADVAELIAAVFSSLQREDNERFFAYMNDILSSIGGRPPAEYQAPEK